MSPDSPRTDTINSWCLVLSQLQISSWLGWPLYLALQIVKSIPAELEAGYITLYPIHLFGLPVDISFFFATSVVEHFPHLG